MTEMQNRFVKWLGIIRKRSEMVGATKEELVILEKAENIIKKYLPAIHEMNRKGSETK